MRASLQPPRGNECLAPVDDLRRSETVTTAHSIRPWRQNLQPLREETKIGSSTGALPVDQGIADPGEVLFFPESEADHQSFLISQIRLNDELSEELTILQRRKRVRTRDVEGRKGFDYLHPAELFSHLF